VILKGTIEYMAEEPVRHVEPRWPAALALLSIGALYYALPSALTVGPDWLVLVFVTMLAIPAMISHRQGNWHLSQLLGYAASTVVTLSVSISLVLLIWRLPGHKETPAQLLRAAGALWVCNLLIFACWYWRLDAGGPHHTREKVVHTGSLDVTAERQKTIVIPRTVSALTIAAGVIVLILASRKT
jgi:hypothetical protein